MTLPPASPGPGDARNGFAIDWAQALGKHRRWLRTVVRSRLENEHAVDDVMQEISLAVWRQNERPTEVTSVAPWLYRVAVRFAINHHRQSGRRRQLLRKAAEHVRAEAEEPEDPRNWVIEQEVHGIPTRLGFRLSENPAR